MLELSAWVLRTGRLSPVATKVRNLAKMADDPNKFLLDDRPSSGRPPTRQQPKLKRLYLRSVTGCGIL